ncbi:MAG: hypothetical protein DCF15_19435 [Phormidesmis priestleyi]|uniref:Dynamin n=1 Tax=Phormidesmis priestleyi TaxID=268141 RepID=A0A2W4WZ02_9CYAN|nr:MAG: hypothetical protein DCF15_19435 [Phormidesmis priestleyi]
MIVKDYAGQFVTDISQDLDRWLKKDVMQTILKPKVDKLEREIIAKLATIEHDLKSIDSDTGAALHEQFKLSGFNVSLKFHSTLNPDAINDATGFWEDLGIKSGGVAAVAALAFVGVGLSPISSAVALVSVGLPVLLAGGPVLLAGSVAGAILLAGGAAGTVASRIFGRDEEEMKGELRIEAYNKGIAKFDEASEEILNKLVENIKSAFEKKAQDFHEAANASISILCNLLEQQESILKETLVQKEAESALIQQKTFQLQTIKQALSDLAETALS